VAVLVNSRRSSYTLARTLPAIPTPDRICVAERIQFVVATKPLYCVPTLTAPDIIYLVCSHNVVRVDGADEGSGERHPSEANSRMVLLTPTTLL
jgi:hypothetical protein